MSGLRITGGTARGRVLQAPPGHGVRPTSSRVREALFSIVGQDLTGLRVLDAFGGSGLLAVEAWSRGATVVCVERDPRHAAFIRENVARVGATVEVVVGDVLLLTAGLGPFDGVLADPPYTAPVAPILERLTEHAPGWLVLEAAARTVVPARAGGLVRDRERPFGDTALHVFWGGERGA
jgi:16S rRNA (guanine966-N2)-methyltransferase